MGRPREFNEDQVLDAVTDVFWTKGYEGTSTRDLAAVTGLTPPSLYNAFGDKRKLFLRALEHYLDKTLRNRMIRLETDLSPAMAITTFFDEIVRHSASDPAQRGCLLVNSTLEATCDDMELRQTVAAELLQLRSFFRRCITAAQQNAEIAVTAAPDDAASHLVAVLLGLRVLARVDPNPEQLSGAAARAMATLGLPAPPAPKVKRPRS
ncbi:TetR/AcrR family transcriptional regulator [Burkholderia multivorans]|uniref:TetR/AcrR family transcriptional regulator n=1 Tax=Burkholderia multivorans TaxID=87883 RepID=UPI00143EB4DA|nr:TetR/AcrR family transcriptional regulator [Burkholderia multivorans]MBU9464676.1 TetR/AcrR family transcriptional regulator [Burkholderia multivorans]MCA8125729.1 TetR/AcrR family transcriptional regulator [Burkholderia multivorans]QIX19164.1 TetR/AcrR family transcriptional regulator [Burkholderia multivorans]